MRREALRTLHFEALREIGRVDCSTPRCRANGRCTGELREDPLIGWAAVYHCPDCDAHGLKSTLPIRQLGAQLVLLSLPAQQALVRRFVDSRPRNTRALSAPWQG